MGEWILTTNTDEPSYNHTRGDSEATPCALCRALAEVERLREAMRAVEYGGCPSCGAEPWVNIDCDLCLRVSAALEGGEK